MLYGQEMTTIESGFEAGFSKSINVMFRNAIRCATRTPRGTCNETTEMEIGWRKADIQFHIVSLRFRARMASTPPHSLEQMMFRI